MNSLINLISHVLGIEFALGDVHITLGGFLFGAVILKIAYEHFLDKFLNNQYLDAEAGKLGFGSHAERERYENYTGSGWGG